MANGPHVLFSIAKIRREEQGRRNYYSGFSVRGAYSSHVMRALTVKPLRTQLAWDDAVNRAALDEEETAPDGAGTVAGGTEPSGGTAGREAGMQWMQERQDMLFTI